MEDWMASSRRSCISICSSERANRSCMRDATTVMESIFTMTTYVPKVPSVQNSMIVRPARVAVREMTPR